MAKLGAAKKSAAKSQKPVLNTTAYHDRDRLSRQERHFDEDYGFVKGRPPRSPAKSDWEHEAISENEPFMNEGPKPYLEKEEALISGKAHGFGHRGEQMHKSGLRLSGHKGAHRIGKR